MKLYKKFKFSNIVIVLCGQIIIVVPNALCDKSL